MQSYLIFLSDLYSYEGAAARLGQLIKLALSILNRLLMLKPANQPPCPLEHYLTSHTTGLPHQPHLIAVMASYIYHRHDPRLPTLATLLLRRLALVSLCVCFVSRGVCVCVLGVGGGMDVRVCWMKHFPHLIAVMASYLYHRHNPRLPRLVTLLLSGLASLFHILLSNIADVQEVFRGPSWIKQIWKNKRKTGSPLLGNFVIWRGKYRNALPFHIGEKSTLLEGNFAQLVVK